MGEDGEEFEDQGRREDGRRGEDGEQSSVTLRKYGCLHTFSFKDDLRFTDTGISCLVVITFDLFPDSDIAHAISLSNRIFICQMARIQYTFYQLLSK